MIHRKACAPKSEVLPRRAISILQEDGVRGLVTASIDWILASIGISHILSPITTNSFAKRSARLNTPDQWIDFAYRFKLWGLPRQSIRPLQVRPEIEKFLSLVARIHPKVVLEIGTNNGGTLYLLSRISSPDAVIISIDLPGGRFGGGYHESRGSLYQSFAGIRQTVHLVRNDSHSPNTKSRVVSVLDGKPLDLLFIDGDHTLEGVSKDFQDYSPLVRPGGIVAFHDIVEHPLATGCRVSDFWSATKARYTFTEIVDNWDQRWAGIGLLYM